MEHLIALTKDANYRTRLGALLGLGELGYKKASPELEKVADTEVLSMLRHYARSSIKEIREKHAEGAKRLEQQEELDKLKDENKELKRRVATLESRMDAATKRRK